MPDSRSAIEIEGVEIVVGFEMGSENLGMEQRKSKGEIRNVSRVLVGRDI